MRPRPVRNFSHRLEYFQADHPGIARNRWRKPGGAFSRRGTASCLERRHKVVLMACFAINASPFQCRWIAAGSEMCVERWTYAICQRCPERPRVMSEEECGHCACWVPCPDGDRIADAHDVRRARRSMFRV